MSWLSLACYLNEQKTQCFTLQAREGKMSDEKSENASEYVTRRRDNGRSSGRGKSSPQRCTQSDEAMRVSTMADEAADHSAVASSGVRERQDRVDERGNRRCHGRKDGWMDEVCCESERLWWRTWILAHEASGIWWRENAGGRLMEAWN